MDWRPNLSDKVPPNRQPMIAPKPYMATTVPTTPSSRRSAETKYIDKNEVTKRPIHRIRIANHNPQYSRDSPNIIRCFFTLNTLPATDGGIAAFWRGVLGQ